MLKSFKYSLEADGFSNSDLNFIDIASEKIKNNYTIRTEVNVVYQNFSIDKVLTDFEADKASAKTQYNNCRIVICGKVSEITKNSKAVLVSAVNGNQEGTIKCSFF